MGKENEESLIFGAAAGCDRARTPVGRFTTQRTPAKRATVREAWRCLRAPSSEVQYLEGKRRADTELTRLFPFLQQACCPCLYYAGGSGSRALRHARHAGRPDTRHHDRQPAWGSARPHERSGKARASLERRQPSAVCGAAQHERRRPRLRHLRRRQRQQHGPQLRRQQRHPS